MRAPTQAPLRTANPTARDASSREHTLCHRRNACHRTTLAMEGHLPPGRQPPVQHLAARPRNGRRRDRERLTPDLPHSGGSTWSPRAHHSPLGRPARLRGTLRGLGSNAQHQPAKVYDSEPTSGSPTRTRPQQQHMPRYGLPQAQGSHRKSVPRPCSQARRYSSGGAHGPTQNAPPISGAGRGTR